MWLQGIRIGSSGLASPSRYVADVTGDSIHSAKSCRTPEFRCQTFLEACPGTAFLPAERNKAKTIWVVMTAATVWTFKALVFGSSPSEIKKWFRWFSLPHQGVSKIRDRSRTIHRLALSPASADWLAGIVVFSLPVGKRQVGSPAQWPVPPQRRHLDLVLISASLVSSSWIASPSDVWSISGWFSARSQCIKCCCFPFDVLIGKLLGNIFLWLFIIGKQSNIWRTICVILIGVKVVGVIFFVQYPSSA